MSLRAGTATTDITPPPGSRMAAFPDGPDRIPRRAEGTLDPVKVRAVALNDGREQILLACADLCIIREQSLHRIRDTVSRRLSGVKPGNILVAVSHTHAGPETSFLFGAAPDDPAVLDIETRITETLVQAHQDLEPVDFSWGRAELALTHNRRVVNTEGRAAMIREYQEGHTIGPVDPELLVMRFTAPDGSHKALLYHYTAHALTLGRDNRLYSADYPGRASRLLEDALPGCTALFLNGAAGNVHPRQCMRHDAKALETIGRAVGTAALQAAGKIRPVASPRLSIATDHLQFTNRADPSLRVNVEIDLVRIGPVMLGFVPGEFFVEFQLRFKQAVAPRPATLVGYANGWPGYVPTQAAYAAGGYGVDLAENDPARYSRTALPPGAGEQIMARLTERVREACDEKKRKTWVSQ